MGSFGKSGATGGVWHVSRLKATKGLARRRARCHMLKYLSAEQSPTSTAVLIWQRNLLLSEAMRIRGMTSIGLFAETLHHAASDAAEALAECLSR